MNTGMQACGDEFVAAAEKHHNLDMLVKDQYGKIKDGKFQGCSVGCFAYEIDPTLSNFRAHELVADHYGYPEWLAHLQDDIFENGGGPDWHVDFAKGVRTFNTRHGDWKIFEHLVFIGILQIALRYAGDAYSPIASVIDLHKRSASGENVPQEEWTAVRAAVDYAVKYSVNYLTIDGASSSAVSVAKWSSMKYSVWALSGAANATAISAVRVAVSDALSDILNIEVSSAAWSAAWVEIKTIVLTLLNSEQLT